MRVTGTNEIILDVETMLAVATNALNRAFSVDVSAVDVTSIDAVSFQDGTRGYRLVFRPRLKKPA